MKATKSTAVKEYLGRYRIAQREVGDTEQRITQLRLQYQAPSAIEYSDMPKAPSVEHDLSDYMQQYEELYETLLAKYSTCLGIMSDFILRVDSMEKQDERELLRYRYIDGLTWQEIADRLGTVERNVYFIHGRALRNFPLPEKFS